MLTFWILFRCTFMYGNNVFFGDAMFTDSFSLALSWPISVCLSFVQYHFNSEFQCFKLPLSLSSSSSIAELSLSSHFVFFHVQPIACKHATHNCSQFASSHDAAHSPIGILDFAVLISPSSLPFSLTPFNLFLCLILIFGCLRARTNTLSFYLCFTLSLFLSLPIKRK